MSEHLVLGPVVQRSREPLVRLAPAARLANRGRCETDPGPRLEYIDSFEAFAALEPAWNALFARAGRSTQVFQQFNWLWHAQRHYGRQPGGAKPAIVVAWQGRDLVLVWPMQLTCGHGICHLAWLGEPVTQYGDILLDDVANPAALVAEAWALLLAEAKPDVVTLRRVRDDAVVAAFREELALNVVETNAAPALDLTRYDGFETYLNEKHSRHQRKEWRRLARRLGERGELAYTRTVPGEDAVETAEAAIELKRRWLDRKQLASKTLNDDRVIAFFKAVAAEDERPVGCRVHAATLDGKVIGAQIMVACKGRLAVHIIVYDIEHQRSRIGVLQLSDTIERAFAEGIETIDLLAPVSDYKLEWSNETVGVCDFAHARTWRGATFVNVFVKRLRPALKRLIPHLPKRLRRLASL